MCVVIRGVIKMGGLGGTTCISSSKKIEGNSKKLISWHFLHAVYLSH